MCSGESGCRSPHYLFSTPHVPLASGLCPHTVCTLSALHIPDLLTRQNQTWDEDSFPKGGPIKLFLDLGTSTEISKTLKSLKYLKISLKKNTLFSSLEFELNGMIPKVKYYQLLLHCEWGRGPGRWAGDHHWDFVATALGVGVLNSQRQSGHVTWLSPQIQPPDCKTLKAAAICDLKVWKLKLLARETQNTIGLEKLLLQLQRKNLTFRKEINWVPQVGL